MGGGCKSEQVLIRTVSGRIIENTIQKSESGRKQGQQTANGYIADNPTDKVKKQAKEIKEPDNREQKERLGFE